MTRLTIVTDEKPLRPVHEAMGACGLFLTIICLVWLGYGFAPDIHSWIGGWR